MLTLLSLPLASEFPCVNLISDLSQCPLGEQEIYYFGIPLNTTQRKRERNKKQKKFQKFKFCKFFKIKLSD